MRLLRFLLLASCLLVAVPALAFLPQNITVDGVNDFDPSNLLKNDLHDTQEFFCSPDSIYPLDIGRVFVSNDNNYLYLGFEWPHKWNCYDKDPKPNIGFAIEVGGTVAGGTADPWGRKIGWASLTNRPDFMVYDVPKNPNDTYHFQVMYKWTGAAWGDSTRLANGSPSGPYALGMVDTTGFVEVRLLLSGLGASAGTNLGLEFWYTQDAGTKGPLDAAFSDNVQMSHFGYPGSTSWDTTAVVQMTTYGAYTVQAMTDVTPPTVSKAVAVQFPLAGDKQFGLTTNKVDVTFSEPVDPTTAAVAGNYTYSGPVTRLVVGAVRDAGATNVVHLLLNSSVSANAAFHNITVQNVKDLAGNFIVANGTTNVGSFFIQNLVFNCNLEVELCKGIFAPTDSFSVEGSQQPLTFESLGDNAMMYDANVDSVYVTTVPFALARDPGTGKAEEDLEYKIVHNKVDYEGGSNRAYHISSDNGASVALSTYWNNDDPANFTTHPIGVTFRVDATRIAPVATDTLWLKGGASPLTFDATPAGIAMMDDGVAPDATAGDKIFTGLATFPSCSSKNIEWKVFYRGAFECLGQGNRSVVLDDALTSITTDARGIERCTVTDKPITVVFRLSGALYPLGSPDTLAVMGGTLPLSFDAPPATLAWMNDAHLGYDATAGDKVWTAGVTFPDSSSATVSYKFWHNGGFECFGYPDRTVTLNDMANSVAVPLVRPVALWNYCSDDVAAVPVATPDAIAGFALLRQSFPNPMSPSTTIRFEMKRTGDVTLSVYDVGGRRVARLLSGTLPPGPHDVQWNGRDESGQRVPAGVYLYELAMGRERLSRRMVITR
jgi:hypothetical protein